MGLSEFGELSFFLALCSIVPALAGFGLPESALYFSGIWAGKNTLPNPLPSINLVVLFQSFSLALILGPVVNLLTPSIFRNIEAQQLTVITVILILISNMWRFACLGFGLLRIVSLERVLTSLIRFTIVIWLFYSHDLSVISVLRAQTYSMLFGSALLCIALMLIYGVKKFISFPRYPHLLRILRYALQQAPSSVLGPLLSRMDQFLLGRLSGSEALGVYSTSVAGAEGLAISTGGFRDLTNGQQAAKLQVTKIAENCKLAFRVSLGALGLTSIIVLLIWNIISASIYVDVIVPLMILAIGGCLGSSGSIAGAVLMGRGKPIYRSLSLLLGLVLDILLLYFLAPNYGAIGAAIATAISGFLTGVLNIYFCQRLLNVNWNVFYKSWISNNLEVNHEK